MLQSQPNIQMQAIFNLIYPVGSLYFSTSLDTVAKVQSAFGGTWEKLPEGYAIWTASSGAGDTIAPGLPNITGSINSVMMNTTWDTPPTSQGALSFGGVITTGGHGGNGYSITLRPMSFNAKNGGSSLYKDNFNTVQPPAYKVYAFRRTALSGGGLRLFLLALFLLFKGGIYVSR